MCDMCIVCVGFRSCLIRKGGQVVTNKNVAKTHAASISSRSQE